MHTMKMLLAIFAISLLFVSCGDDDDSNPSSNNNDIGQAADGEGVYSLSGDQEVSGSGAATHNYKAAYTSDGTTFALHEVEIEDTENDVFISIEFYILDPEADMFSGKEPDETTYKIFNPGLSTPDEDYVNISAYNGEYDYYFSTAEESQLELIKHDNGIWEAELENFLDDFDTDEEVTLKCNFKANPVD